MRKITGKELRDILTNYIIPFEQLSHDLKEEWEDRARNINSYFYTPDLDEQSNECPIPNLQEGD